MGSRKDEEEERRSEVVYYLIRFYAAASTSSLVSMQGRARGLLQYLGGGLVLQKNGAFVGVSTTVPQFSAGRGSLGLYEPVSKGGIQGCS